MQLHSPPLFTDSILHNILKYEFTVTSRSKKKVWEMLQNISYIPVVKLLRLITEKHDLLSWATCEELKKSWFFCYVSNWRHFIVSPPVNYAFVWAVFGDYKSRCSLVGRFRKWHQLTGQWQRQFCVQEVVTEKSIFVISTGPFVTIRICGGQVVQEGCYQLFINSSLNSSCGQLKRTHVYWSNASFSLETNK